MEVTKESLYMSLTNRKAKAFFLKKTEKVNRKLNSTNPSVSILQICVRYAGVDIPGSPFQMSSNPVMDDVIVDSNEAFGQNGTGVQKKGKNSTKSGHFSS